MKIGKVLLYQNYALFLEVLKNFDKNLKQNSARAGKNHLPLCSNVHTTAYMC